LAHNVTGVVAATHTTAYKFSGFRGGDLSDCIHLGTDVCCSYSARTFRGNMHLAFLNSSFTIKTLYYPTDAQIYNVILFLH